MGIKQFSTLIEIELENKNSFITQQFNFQKSQRVHLDCQFAVLYPLLLNSFNNSKIQLIWQLNSHHCGTDPKQKHHWIRSLEICSLQRDFNFQMLLNQTLPSLVGLLGPAGRPTQILMQIYPLPEASRWAPYEAVVSFSWHFGSLSLLRGKKQRWTKSTFFFIKSEVHIQSTRSTIMDSRVPIRKTIQLIWQQPHQFQRTPRKSKRVCRRQRCKQVGYELKMRGGNPKSTPYLKRVRTLTRGGQD